VSGRSRTAPPPLDGDVPHGPLKKIRRRRSPISGWGVYAAERITKNSRIIDYAGERITHKESSRREERQLARGCIWCFKVNLRWVRDAEVGGNLARFLNHSCRPNCYTQVIGHTIWIRAARNIRAGEELTYDYNTDGNGGVRCHCRPGCRTVL
jgi:SET domain-containing protein